MGGGNYGVGDDTLRQQMAVFLLKAKYGLCYAPPPCTVQVFTDVPCSLGLSPRGSTSSSPRGSPAAADAGLYCPTSPVLRQQMAVLLLETYEAPGYTPPACANRDFHGRAVLLGLRALDLRARRAQHHGRLRRGNLLPLTSANRGQMATFVVKTFGLQ